VTQLPPPSQAPTAPPPSAAVASPRPRLAGVDMARGLAIVGMISVHVAPTLGGEGGWYAVPYGRASTLFALVAGVGIVLASRRGTHTTNVSRLLWRAAWLAPLGVLLGALGTPVAVILQYYALWFVLAAPLLRTSTRTLAWITGVGILIGPTILVWSHVAYPGWYAPGRGVWLGELGDVLLTGYYPTVSWIWLVTLGMIVARLDLTDRTIQQLLLVVGSATAVAGYALGAAYQTSLQTRFPLGGWERLVDTMGHADGPLEQVTVAGLTVAVLALCLIIGDVAAPAVAPIIALGRFALTVYVGHILVYAAVPDTLRSATPAEGVWTTLTISVIGAVIAMAWLSVWTRGPLEALDRAGHRWLIVPTLHALGLHTDTSRL
jgi:uncharacterized membrane protein YeiB